MSALSSTTSTLRGAPGVGRPPITVRLSAPQRTASCAKPSRCGGRRAPRRRAAARRQRPGAAAARRGTSCPAPTALATATSPPCSADELVHEREPDAAALVAAPARAVDAVEALEQPRAAPPPGCRRRCRRPRSTARRPCAHAQLDPALERELVGVREQVQEDLLEHVRVGVDRSRRPRAVDRRARGPARSVAERNTRGELAREPAEVDRREARRARGPPRSARSPAAR